MDEETAGKFCVNCANLAIGAEADVAFRPNVKLPEEEISAPTINNTENCTNENILPGQPEANKPTTGGQTQKTYGPEEIATVLVSIYKLNFLTSFDDDPVFECAPALCSPCSDVLAKLQKSYEEFNNLRRIESDLAKKLAQLDSIIENQRQNVVKCEVLTEEGDGEINFLDDFASCDSVEEIVEPRGSTVHSDLCGPGPWVVLKKIQIPEGKTSVKTRKVADVDSDNGFDLSEPEPLVDSSGPGSPDFDSDSDFEVRKKPKAKKAPTSAKRGPKRGSTRTPKATKSPTHSKSKKTKSKNDDTNGGKSGDDAASAELPDGAPVVKKKRGRKPKLIDGMTLKEWKQREKAAKAKAATKKLKKVRLEKIYRRRKVRHANPCWHCKLTFESQEDCKTHTMAEHYQPEDIICEVCSRVCKTKSSFTQHKKICEELRPGEKLPPFECPICKKTFSWKNYLQTHIRMHGDERPFPCSKCNYRAKSKMLIRMHFNRMHSDLPQEKYKCGECGSWFKNEQCMKIHQYKMHTEEGYKRYREQQRALLDKQKEQRKQRQQNRSFVCTECNIDFFTNLRLLCHKKTFHQVEKKFVCEQCGKDFSRNHSLRHHIVHVHSEDRPFICEHCGKAFKTNYNLKDHVSHTHTEEGRLKYNEFMRLHNKRRKMVAEALARKKEPGRSGGSNASEEEIPTTAMQLQPPPPSQPQPASHWQAAAAAAGLCLPLNLNQAPDSFLHFAQLSQLPNYPAEFDTGSSQSSV